MGVGSNFGGNIFSLAEIAVGTRADSEITTSSTASNTGFLQTSRKPKDRRQPAKKTSNSTPVGKKGGHRLGKRVYWYSFLFWGNSGPGCPLLASCVFVFACLSVVYCSYQVIIFLGAEESMGRKKKTNEERNRRASIFLPNNPLKITTTRFGPFRTSVGDRIITGFSRS